MKAISLWQPWASLIAAGGKQIETRHWAPSKSLIGKPLAICSTKSTPTADLAEAWRCPEIRAFMTGKGLMPGRMPVGVVLAVCIMKDVVPITHAFAGSLSPLERSAGFYAPGRFAWLLENIVALRTPLQVTGRQGIFDVTGVCRVCGCTDSDCSGCIAITGLPCSWIEPDLCSACAELWDRDAEDLANISAAKGLLACGVYR